jgi:hypothetical protein
MVTTPGDSTPGDSTAAFSARLSAAVAANSFSLEDVQVHLARRGRSATLASITSWLDGRDLPRSPGTAAALEDVLRIVPGSLARLIEPPTPDAAPRGDHEPVPDDFSLPPSERLRRSFHPDAPNWSRTLRSEAEVVLGPGHFITEVRNRFTEQALVDDVDRYLMIACAEESRDLISFRTVPLHNCRRGRILMDPERFLICTELLLDHSYSAGETFTLECVMVFDRPSLDAEYFRVARDVIPFDLINVKFVKSELPARCHQVVEQEMGEIRQTKELRPQGTSLSSVVTNLPPGMHGVSWEWE